MYSKNQSQKSGHLPKESPITKLFNVAGTVVAVDEDNATYLPVCDACGGHLSESKERYADQLIDAICTV